MLQIHFYSSFFLLVYFIPFVFISSLYCGVTTIYVDYVDLFDFFHIFSLHLFSYSFCFLNK